MIIHKIWQKLMILKMVLLSLWIKSIDITKKWNIVTMIKICLQKKQEDFKVKQTIWSISQITKMHLTWKILKTCTITPLHFKLNTNLIQTCILLKTHLWILLAHFREQIFKSIRNPNSNNSLRKIRI